MKNINITWRLLVFIGFIYKAQAATVMQQAVANTLVVAGLGVRAAVVPLNFRIIQEQIVASKQRAPQSRTLDHELLKLMMVNRHGITVDSFNDYLFKHVTKVPSAQNAKAVEIIAPVTLVLPREQHMANNKAVEVKQAQVFLKFDYKSANYQVVPNFNAHHQQPVAKFSLAIDNVPSGVPNSIAKRDREIEVNRQRILADPIAREAYASKVRANIDLLWNFLGLRGPIESLKAQCQINSLWQPMGIGSGNILMSDVKPQLQNLLMSKGHFQPLITTDELGKALEIIAPYIEASYINQPDGYIHFLKQCQQVHIPGAEILIARATRTNSWGDSVGSFFSSITPHFCNLKTEEITQAAFIKDFKALNAFCALDEFSDAESIVVKYKIEAEAAKDIDIKRALAREHYAFKLIYDDYYYKLFNRYDIRLAHTDDPYYHSAKLLLDACYTDQKDELKAIVKETVEARQIKLAELLSRVGAIKEQSPLVRALGYALIDAKSPQEAIQILMPLAQNHEDPDYVTAYNIFFENGFPKLLESNEAAKVIPISSKIAQSRYADARKLYNLCGSLNLKTEKENQAIDLAIHYIAHALEDSALEKKYLLIAEKIYDALVFADADKSVLILPNFLKQFPLAQQNEMRDKLLVIASNLFENAEDVCVDDKHITVKDGNRSTFIKGIAHAFEYIQSNNDTTLKLLPFLLCINSDKEIDQSGYGCGAGSIKESNIEGECGTSELVDRNSIPMPSGCLPARQEKPMDCGGLSINEKFEPKEMPQCNSSKRFGQLRPLGDSGTEEEVQDNGVKQAEVSRQENDRRADNALGAVEGVKERDAIADIDQIKSEEESLNAELEKIAEQLKVSVKGLTQEDSLIIDEFIDFLRMLIPEYGLKNIIKAIDVSGLNGKKVITKKNVRNALVWTSKSLKKIEADAAYEKFTCDPAHNGKIEIGTLEEAIAGIACIEQKILKNLKRSGHKAEEFIEFDENMTEWDVKTARSYSLFDGKHIFRIESFNDALRTGLRDGQNLIIQITDLDQPDLKKLYKSLGEEFTKEQWQKMVIIHASDPSKTKSTKALIQALEE